MSRKFLTPKDIIESIKVHEGKSMFKLAEKGTNPTYYKRKKEIGDIGYAQLRWLNKDGKWVFPHMKVSNMLVCGGAKSYISNYENIQRNVTFGFSNLERS